jgi:hypothetical protein
VTDRASQHDRLEEGEDGARGADAEGERQDAEGCEGSVPRDQANPEAEVLDQGLARRRQSPHAPGVLLDEDGRRSSLLAQLSAFMV